MFNADKWDSLTEEQQEILQKCSTDMCDNIITLIRKDVEDMTKKMEKRRLRSNRGI